jgi:hypothetical protein
MAGYNDPKYAKGPVKGPDVRWRGHQVPPDPEPENGAIRVFARGKWMTWDAWRAAPTVIQDDNRPAPPLEGSTLSTSTPTPLKMHQICLFDLN